MNNLDWNNVSLLIQGPIYSFGDTYSGIKSEFHSMKFIIQNVKSFRKYSNGEILLSTYETQLSLIEAKFLRKLGVNIIELEIRDMSEYKTINLSNNPDTNRHGMNQYYSTYHGLIKLSNDPHNRFVIKIRTDIKIDFSLIFDSKINLFNKKVTFTHLRKLFKFGKFVKPFIPDFVLIGEMSSLLKLFKRLYLNNFSSFVHLDLATGLL